MISSVRRNSSTDRVNAGNPDLIPQQAWEFRGTIEHPLLGDGVAKIDVGYNLINDLQDRVLIFDDEGHAFDAPGNIGTGKLYFAKLTLDAPLAKIGLNGMRLKFNGQLQRTRVEDPISGEKRNFSGEFPDWDWTVEFRHDLGRISRTALPSMIATGSPSSGPMSSTPITMAGPMERLSSNIGRAPAPPSRSISTMRSTLRATATDCFSFPIAPSPTLASTNFANATAI